MKENTTQRGQYLYAAIDGELSETPEAFRRDGEDFNSCVSPNYQIQIAWSREVALPGSGVCKTTERLISVPSQSHRVTDIDRSWVLGRDDIIVRHFHPFSLPPQ